MTAPTPASGRTVLVTGGAGFIGSELVRHLLGRGDRVIVVDNFINGSRANLPADAGDRLVVVDADIRDVATVGPHLAGAAVVFHLACLGVRHSVHAPVENHHVNATGTLGLLEASRAAGVGRFVYVSSSEVYGTALWAPMTEMHPTFPCTVYGGSKLAGESYARAYFRTYGYPTVVVRPFNTYGPRSHHEGDSGEVIPKFLLRCLAGRPMVIFGDGTQTRDFTYVSDSARGILLAGEHPDAVGRTINLGFGAETTIGELARTVARVAGRPDAPTEHVEGRPGDVLRLYADMTQARDLLGYAPTVSLEDGLTRLLAWYREQGTDPATLLERDVVRNWIPRMIPVAKPWMDEAEAAAARRAILSGWVTQGPEVAAFEAEFAAAVGAPHACAASSCTTAMHLALVALGIGAGDEVITVSHSFIATANAVRYTGAVPVFVDVEPATGNIDPARVEAAITPRTRAILAVHQLGLPCDLTRVAAVAARHGLRLVEDAACAIGSEVREGEGDAARWVRVGRPHGDVACFSFHPRKLLSTGDGGMITTRDAAIDAACRRLRQHGMDVPDTVRHGSPSVVFESYPELGFNYRMTDIQAAIGRVQLGRLPAMIERRRHLAARYHAGLSGVPGLTVPSEPAWARSNWQTYAVRVDDPARQRPVMQALLDRGIATRRGVMNAHREAAYPAGAFREGPGGLAHGERIQDTAIALPLFHQLTEPEQDTVIAAVRDVAGTR